LDSGVALALIHRCENVSPDERAFLIDMAMKFDGAIGEADRQAL
jgi:hypothetical protein